MKLNERQPAILRLIQPSGFRKADLRQNQKGSRLPGGDAPLIRGAQQLLIIIMGERVARFFKLKPMLFTRVGPGYLVKTFHQIIFYDNQLSIHLERILANRTYRPRAHAGFLADLAHGRFPLLFILLNFPLRQKPLVGSLITRSDKQVEHFVVIDSVHDAACMGDWVFSKFGPGLVVGPSDQHELDCEGRTKPNDSSHISPTQCLVIQETAEGRRVERINNCDRNTGNQKAVNGDNDIGQSAGFASEILRFFLSERMVIKQDLVAAQLVPEDLSNGGKVFLETIGDRVALYYSEQCNNAECQQRKQAPNDHETELGSVGAMFGAAEAEQTAGRRGNDADKPVDASLARLLILP